MIICGLWSHEEMRTRSGCGRASPAVVYQTVEGGLAPAPGRMITGAVSSARVCVGWRRESGWGVAPRVGWRRKQRPCQCGVWRREQRPCQGGVGCREHQRPCQGGVWRRGWGGAASSVRVSVGCGAASIRARVRVGWRREQRPSSGVWGGNSKLG